MDPKPGDIRYHKKLGIKAEYLGTLGSSWYHVNIENVSKAILNITNILVARVNEIPPWEWGKHWTTEDPKLSSGEIWRVVKIMKILWRFDKIPDEYSVWYLDSR